MERARSSSPRNAQRVTLWPGDCVAVMAGFPESSVDAIVTDPPYGLGFMGKEWDTIGDTGRGARARVERADEVTPIGQGHSTSAGPYLAAGVDSLRSAGLPFQQWSEAWAREALRILKPGGCLLAFGGSRTYHRLAAGIEDAGFEIRDTIMWLYGSGFPKNKALLKPAHEPIVLARKPTKGSPPLNIDACRIEGTKPHREVVKRQENDWDGGGPWKSSGVGSGESDIGRWPANVVMDAEAGALLDRQAGPRAPGNHPANRQGIGFTAASGGTNSGTKGERRPLDGGGASRFFYCAKPDTAERHAGLADGASLFSPTDAPERNDHPTVKPIDLMRWLCRLVTPPGGVVLDPFMGSGTTGCAAALEGFRFVGIEREDAYLRIAQARLAHWSLEAA